MLNFAPNELKSMRDAISCYPEIKKAIIFGERATNPETQSADIQLAIDGDGIDDDVSAGLEFQLRELQKIPYNFEIFILPKVSDQAVLDKVKETGQTLFPA